MKSQFAIWAVGALALGVFWLLGETVSKWISSKDTVTDSLHKRVFHLMELLGFSGLIFAVMWFILKYFGYFK
jgi:hypothetical protein